MDQNLKLEVKNTGVFSQSSRKETIIQSHRGKLNLCSSKKNYMATNDNKVKKTRQKKTKKPKPLTYMMKSAYALTIKKT